jgi:hypothetical protein
LEPEHLAHLHQKTIRFFVWCVMGYGSRLQPAGWFAEIALYLEFVLDQPPSFVPPDGAIPGVFGPFRVRIAGYRYREDRDHKNAARSSEDSSHDTQTTSGLPL